MPKNYDLVGQRHGRLTCVEYLGLQKRSDGRNNKIWRCVCDCGKEKILTTGLFHQDMSCGCLTGEIAHKNRYKGRNKRLYGVLSKMRERCYDPNFIYYYNYGGRGIKVCDEWLGIQGIDNFQKWALENGYRQGLTIDRIDNDKDYSPDNCRWVDMKTQSNNKRNNVYFEMDGRTQTLTQWCDEYNVPYSRVRIRVQGMGWDLKEALLTPRYGKKGEV